MTSLKLNRAFALADISYMPMTRRHIMRNITASNDAAVLATLTTHRDARMWLDLSMAEANYLFHYSRTIEDFRAVISGRCDSTGYDRDGYDRDDLDAYNQPKL